MNKNTPSQYLRDILILLFGAMVLGTYLLLTTVVVSKDSVGYISRAQFLQEDPPEDSIVSRYRAAVHPDEKVNPEEILAERPSGYEVLILLGYRIFYAIAGNSSVQGWIWAAQGLTLLCRTLALIALYLIGCLLTHRKNSFWGCIILLLLPEPAHWGSDVLREWPYLLFMGLSVLSLLYAIHKKSIWPIVLTGMFTGIGFLIRLESIQFVLLGLFVLLLLMLKQPEHYTRRKALIGTILLIAGFAGPNLVYANYSGQATNNYLKDYVKKVLSVFDDSGTNEENMSALKESATATKEVSKTAVGQSQPPKENMPLAKEPDTPANDVTEVVQGESLLSFAYELFKKTGELLVWLYLPFWIIGLYARFQDKADPMIRYIITALILMGIMMLLMRYFCKEAKITQRWVLPLVALTVCFIHSGIEQFGVWIERRKAADLRNPQKWGRILVAAGILICLMQLTEPLGAGNRTYLEAASWIRENTQEDDWFYTHDGRIPFYAERNHSLYNNVDGFLNPHNTKYLIIPVKNMRSDDDLPEGVTLAESFYQKDGEGEEFLIYECDL